MYTGNDYKSKGRSDKSSPCRDNEQNEHRQEFLDYLAQPHWFDKVLREIKQRDREDDECRSPDTPRPVL